MAAIETTLRSGCLGLPSGDENVPGQITVHMDDPEGEYTSPVQALAEIRADLVDLQITVSRSCNLVREQLVTLQKASDEQEAITRAKFQQMYDALQCEVMYLGMRLDQLQNRNN
ncbi:hypothetical protein ACFOY2_39455 [Nonomuraea purpurea]|uniref:Uncharacterized protein n=1 Tax=Nonomuraea purpurea TaxID=1849276 RepID=A0ABV8GK96_9ACTN